MSKTENIIVCTMCHEEFEPDWSDEEASLEFQQTFPGHDIRNARVICDDCWTKLGLAS